MAADITLAPWTCETPCIIATTPSFLLKELQSESPHHRTVPWEAWTQEVQPHLVEGAGNVFLCPDTTSAKPSDTSVARGLLAWPRRPEPLMVSTSMRFHGESCTGVGLATGQLHGFPSKRPFHGEIVSKESLCLLLEVVWLCGPESSLGKSTSARILFFFFLQ